MTQPAQQPEPLPIDYLECARMDIHGNTFLSGGELLVNIKEVDAVIDTLKAERSRSRPHTSTPSNDYRDLFVSDLIKSLEWDAKNGNPELFKAVTMLRMHYNEFTVEQHDATIRNATLDAIIEFTKGNSETIEADDGSLEDAVFLGELLAKIESLRGEL